MAAMNNTINVLKPFLEKMEEVYGETLRFDDNESKKFGHFVGEGSVVLSISERDGSLTIQVYEKKPSVDANGYLTYRGSQEQARGFAYKKPEEVQEIINKLCVILLETPANCIDAKTVKQKVMAAEFACYQKYHPISEQAMQRMRFEAERAELNMSLNKG